MGVFSREVPWQYGFFLRKASRDYQFSKHFWGYGKHLTAYHGMKVFWIGSLSVVAIVWFKYRFWNPFFYQPRQFHSYKNQEWLEATWDKDRESGVHRSHAQGSPWSAANIGSWSAKYFRGKLPEELDPNAKGEMPWNYRKI